MGTINQSVCFGCFARGAATPEQIIREAAEIGYKSVEMLPQQYWPLVRQHGMEVAIIIGHASLPDGLNKRENHDPVFSCSLSIGVTL